MWAILKSSRHGGWRPPHTYRTPGERVSTLLWWTVIAITVVAATTYTVYLFQV